MDRPVHDICIVEELRKIFNNQEIYANFILEERYPNNPLYRYNNSTYWVVDLTIKQRQADFLVKRETWNHEFFLDAINQFGMFQAKSQAFSQHNSGIITNYKVHITDMDGFKKHLVKLSEELYNREFTKQLESKLSED